MRILAPLMIVWLSLVACSETKSTSTPPPPEMVGVWAEAVPQSSSSGVGAQDPCNGLSVGSGSVSSVLFKVDEFGNVFDGKEMTDINNPYRIIGTMDSSGKITPNAVGRREFLGNFAGVSGVTMNPIVTTSFGFDPIKGQYIALDIELQIISQGQTVTQPWEKREYFKLTETIEKSLITKAQQCLSKTKP